MRPLFTRVAFDEGNELRVPGRVARKTWPQRLALQSALLELGFEEGEGLLEALLRREELAGQLGGLLVPGVVLDECG